MKLKLWTIGGFAAILLLTAGCGTSSQYVDSTDTVGAVKNPNRMSSSDWVEISRKAGQALLVSQPFADYLEAYSIDAAENLRAMEEDGESFTTREKQTMTRPLLILDTIQNNTAEHIDTKLMTERLRETLFNSSKVRFTTYAAGSGQSIVSSTAEVRDLKKDSNVRKSTVAKKGKVNAPDLALAGVIIAQNAKDGRSREISYTFSLTLTDLNNGEGVWSYTEEIKRQHKQGGIGW